MQATGAAQKTKRGHRQRVTCKARNLERGFKKKSKDQSDVCIYIYIYSVDFMDYRRCRVFGGNKDTQQHIYICIYIYI